MLANSPKKEKLCAWIFAEERDMECEDRWKQRCGRYRIGDKAQSYGPRDKHTSLLGEAASSSGCRFLPSKIFIQLEASHGDTRWSVPEGTEAVPGASEECGSGCRNDTGGRYDQFFSDQTEHKTIIVLAYWLGNVGGSSRCEQTVEM
jgi:hypothetical protein